MSHINNLCRFQHCEAAAHECGGVGTLVVTWECIINRAAWSTRWLVLAISEHFRRFLEAIFYHNITLFLIHFSWVCRIAYFVENIFPETFSLLQDFRQ